MAEHCASCGSALITGARFCASCGAPVAAAVPAPLAGAPPAVEDEQELWTGAPDVVLAPIAALKTRYRLTTHRLTIDHGIIGKSMIQLPLFRIKDIEVHKSPIQRARRVGDILIVSTDPLMAAVKLEKIAEVDKVAELLRKNVLEARRTGRVFVAEGM